MSKLRYSPEALNDLDAIWSYIHDELQNPVAAQKTVSAILDTIEKLRDFPKIGILISAITDIDSDYRYLVCGKYISFYRIEVSAVIIDRILYGRRDYIRVLFGDLSEEDV